jgi:DNA-binding transcriptional regulator WhiA
LLAYVVGIALGDGNLSNPNGRATRLRVTCDARYPRLARKIALSLRLLLPRNRVRFVRKRGNCLDISCYSNRWEAALGWRVGHGTKISQKVSIPEWIMQRAEYAVPCLRGLLETDGSTYTDRGYHMVAFSNASATLARDVERVMVDLGFAPHVYKITANRKRPIYHVRLSKNVSQFLTIVRPRKA